ncbi:GumC family protein [Allorhizobium undicola]|uniref:GumC family protein n=1 Tax=Allorhizobium undicola TaxID=78527 RepID=UPI003D34AAD2
MKTAAGGWADMDIDIFQIPGILKRRWLILALCTLLCLGAALLFAATLKPSFSSYTQILLDPKALSADTADNRAVAASQPDPASIDSQIYVVQSSAVLGEVIRDLDLTRDPALYKPKPGAAATDEEVMAATMAGLLKRMKVERQGQSLIMAITVDHPVAQSAATIANRIAAIYLKQVDEARNDAARRASNAFQAQASELRDRVLKAEMAVEQFKSDNGLASTADKGLVIDQQLAGLNDQLIAARGAEEQQRAIYEQTRNLTLQAIEAGAIPEAVQSTSIGLLRDRYVQLLDRQAEATTNLGANHPQLRAINSQVASMRTALQQELDRVRQSMKANFDRASANTKALSDRLDSLTRSSFDSGEKQIKLRQLESEADAVRTIYKAFLNRAEELGQQQTTAINNSRVITEAVPTPKSVTVLRLMIVLAALLFGLALGSVLAVLRELASAGRQPQPDIVFTQPSSAAPGNDISRLTARIIPVLADARTPPTSARSRFGWLLRPLSSRTGDEAASLQDSEARMRHASATISRFLLDCAQESPRLTIVFLASGRPAMTASFIGDVIQRLTDREHSLLYAAGHFASRTYRGRHPALAEAQAEPGQDAPPLSGLLKYERFGPARIPPGEMDGRPSFARYLARNGVGLDADFILVNACGTEAETCLAELAPQADLILLLTDDESEAPLADMQARLGSATDRLMGRILLDSSAGGHT